MRDLYNNVEIRRALDPQIQTNSSTAFVSEIIDMRGFKSMMWCVILGSLTDADMTTVFLMEDSDDSGLSPAVAVVDAEMDPTEVIAAFDFGDDDSVRKIGYTGERRYVRLTVTPTSNDSGAIEIAIMALMGDPDERPTTAQATSV